MPHNKSTPSMRGVWCRGVSWLSAQEEPRWPGVRRRWDPWPTTSGHGRGRRLLRRVQSAWLLCQWRLVLLQALQVVGWLQWPADQIMVSSAAANQGFTAATGRDKLCEWTEEEQVLATTVKIDVSDHRTNMAIREFIGGYTHKNPVNPQGNYRQRLVAGYSHLTKDHLIQRCGDLGLDTLATVDTLKEWTKSWGNYEAAFVAQHAPEQYRWPCE